MFVFVPECSDLSPTMFGFVPHRCSDLSPTMFGFVPIHFSKTLILQGFGGSFFLDKTKKTIFVKQQQNFKNLKK